MNKQRFEVQGIAAITISTADLVSLLYLLLKKHAKKNKMRHIESKARKINIST